MKYLIMIAMTLGLHSTSAARGSYQENSDWKTLYSKMGWGTNDAAVEVKETIVLKPGQIFDGKGRLYRWVGKHKDWCHAPKEISEDAPRMFVMGKGSKIKNMQVECSLDGFIMNDNTEISNVVFRDCEEDCITTKGLNNRIIGNKFFLADDKAIQMNKAQGVLIEGNEFTNCGRALSGSGRNSGGARGVIAKNNLMTNVEIGIRAQHNHEVRAEGNTLVGGRDLFETVEASVIYDCGGNSATAGAQYRSAKGSDNIKECRDFPARPPAASQKPPVRTKK